mmetsp:Transcript_38828/g.67753  ORF Transcript_38828/g.67753 Transcript_38828/m.67753 type:complete len:103 (+) Transcript_38828:113-421(+)
MASGNRKDELRALMKQQKQKLQQNTAISSKYQGKSKQELLAILKAKQLEAKKKTTAGAEANSSNNKSCGASRQNEPIWLALASLESRAKSLSTCGITRFWCR